jgi:hypothetical protein
LRWSWLLLLLLRLLLSWQGGQELLLQGQAGMEGHAPSLHELLRQLHLHQYHLLSIRLLVQSLALLLLLKKRQGRRGSVGAVLLEVVVTSSCSGGWVVCAFGSIHGFARPPTSNNSAEFSAFVSAFLSLSVWRFVSLAVEQNVLQDLLHTDRVLVQYWQPRGILRASGVTLFDTKGTRAPAGVGIPTFFFFEI